MYLVAIVVLSITLVGTVVAWQVAHRRLVAERARSDELTRRLGDQQALEMRSAGLLALSEAAYNALIVVDRDRRVIHMNSAACSLFACDTYNTDITLMTLTRSYDLDHVVDQVLQDGEPVDLQIAIRAVAYRVRAQRTETPAGHMVAIALEDVSELLRLGRARRDMVANISHELRTPIASIRLLVDTLLREEMCPDKECTERLHKIAAEADILQQMAQELLDLSMIESGRAEFIFRPVKLRDIVAEVADQYTEQAERKKLTLERHVSRHLVVLADAQQLRRVLSNLVHNAIKFTPSHGTIDISANMVEDRVLIAVTDSGPGISPEERERVFERFYRGDRARRSSGTGLGLAIAKHIVEAHGGTIWVEDSPKPPGARVCFTLTLGAE